MKKFIAGVLIKESTFVKSDIEIYFTVFRKLQINVSEKSFSDFVEHIRIYFVAV